MPSANLNLESALSRLSLLTRREWGILIFVSEGMDSKSIARNVNVMPKSIDNYRNRISNKLGIKGYGQLLDFATNYRSHLRKTFERLTPSQSKSIISSRVRKRLTTRMVNQSSEK